MKLVDVSVKRPVGVIMFVLAALVLGAISLRNLAVDLLPEMEFPIAVVVTNYEGAAPQEIEQLITKPLEQSVGSIEGVTDIESMSQPGTSFIVMFFNWGTNMDESMNRIREKVDQIAGFLPEDASRPTIIKIDPSAMPVMWLGLNGASPEKLQQIAENEIVPQFERASGVASVAIEGGKKREILVELDRTKLQLYGISGQQVIQALAMENRSASAGNLTRGIQELQLRIDGEFASLKDIENTSVMLPGGGAIKVKDVATIKDTFKEENIKSFINGEEALVLSIMKQSDANTVQVSDEVRKIMKSLEKELEEDGLSLSLIIDTSDFIRQSIRSVIDNMILGSVLAVGILLLFLRSIRTTLVIGLSIPIAVISTFILMYFTGETVNIISMGGLALGVGIMVDSSIVILENIFTKRRQGLPAVQAARDGASELGSALIASTTTTVVVFLPIVFVEGLAAQVFRPLSLTVTFSITASVVVALTLIPMLASKMLHKVKIQPEDAEKLSRFERGFEKFKSFYERTLRIALQKRKTVIGITFALFLASLALASMIGAEFLPASDQGQIQINVTAQEGSTLEETAEIIDQMNAKIDEYAHMIDTYYVSIGAGTGFGDGVPNEAMYMIQLVPPSEREMTTTQFMKKLEEILMADIAGAEITIASVESHSMGSSSPIQVNINGPDLDVLSDLAQQVVWILEDIEGTGNIETTIEEGRPELTVKVDRDIAAAYGLSYQQIMNEITLGFSGQIATRYREGGSEFDVRVVFPEDERQSIRDLETMTIRNNQGVEVPLTAVAELRQVQGPMQINRSNQQREVRVTSELFDRDLGSVYSELEKELTRMNLPDGYHVSIGGDIEEMLDAFEQLALALILSVFLVYMVMAVQFESFWQPFIIMFSMPTMIIGVILGLFVTNTALSVPAFIGLIMLAGIVVNNAIILVDYMNILRRRGMEKMEAIVEGGKGRLRPVLMTTLTTVLGMVPLALGIGEGTEMSAPMAIVIIFGLLSSTVFTLVLIPVIYSFGRDDEMKKERKIRFAFWRKKQAELKGDA